MEAFYFSEYHDLHNVFMFIWSLYYAGRLDPREMQPPIFPSAIQNAKFKTFRTTFHVALVRVTETGGGFRTTVLRRTEEERGARPVQEPAGSHEWISVVPFSVANQPERLDSHRSPVIISDYISSNSRFIIDQAVEVRVWAYLLLF
jgi:hypothetical protein